MSLKVIHIDAEARVVREAEAEGLEGVQALVGGYVQVATRLPGGHILLVDEDGLLGRVPHAFAVLGAEAPAYIGNGVVLREGRTDWLDATVSVDEVAALVRFVERPRYR